MKVEACSEFRSMSWLKVDTMQRLKSLSSISVLRTIQSKYSFSHPFENPTELSLSSTRICSEGNNIKRA